MLEDLAKAVAQPEPIASGQDAECETEARVSVLLPTRGRVAPLLGSIESLLVTAKGPVEILLRRDEDDETELPGLPAPVKAVSGPRYGYPGLHRYINELCEIAVGEWLLLWNDDALMQTPGWDEIVDGYTGQFKVLSPRTNHGGSGVIFPVIPRELYRILGHFSLNAHNDTWIEELAKGAGILEPIPVEVLHDRFDLTGENEDATYCETRSSADTAGFFSAEMCEARAQDIATIRRFLDS